MGREVVLALLSRLEMREYKGEQAQLTMQFYCRELPVGHLIHLLEGTGRLGTVDHNQAKGMPIFGAAVRNVIKVKIEMEM